MTDTRSPKEKARGVYRASRCFDVTRYSRQDAIRILRLGTRQLLAWERAGLVLPTEDYSFEQLGQLRMLRDLCARRISVRSIRASVDAMRRAGGMRDVLLEASAAGRGSRLTFRHGGALVDPLTQQMAFDFEGAADRELSMTGVRSRSIFRDAAEVQHMFLKAVQMEEDPDSLPDALSLYQAILEVRPQHAPALINLGTIFYNQRNYAEAERLYRSATEADPEYALAFFDLGNVLDETQHLSDAIAAYQKAVTLVPQYADAHYNLALAYERQGQRRKALRHWLTYVRLDPAGPWSAHARGQARKILKSEKLSIVSRGGELVQVS